MSQKATVEFTRVRYLADFFGDEIYLCDLSFGCMRVDARSGAVFAQLTELRQVQGREELRGPITAEVEYIADTDAIPGPSYSSRCTSGRLL
jgi:hypothetical protein